MHRSAEPCAQGIHLHEPNNFQLPPRPHEAMTSPEASAVQHGIADGPPAWRWGAAAVLGVAAMGLRAALEPWLQGTVPFVFAFPAVVAAALMSGAGPGLLALAVCALFPLVPGLPETIRGNVVPQVLPFVASGIAVVVVCSWLLRRITPATAVHGESPAPAGTGYDQGRHVQQWLRMLIALALLLPAMFFISAAWQGYRAQFKAAEERAVRTSTIAREHALKVMRTSEMLFDLMEERTADRTEAELRADRRSLDEQLRRITRTTPEVQSLAVWDREGRPLALTVPYSVPPDFNAADREYFTVHREADKGLFVSAPFYGRLDASELRVVISKRRNGPAGEFAGVNAVSLRASAFSEFYRELTRAEPGASISFFRSNGTIVMREPPPPVLGMIAPPTGPMMARVAAGEASGLTVVRSPVDQKRRVIAFRRIDSYPLYVSASIADDAILSSWYSEVALLAAFTFPTSLALAWVSWVALKHTRRERTALEQWRAEISKRTQVEDVLRQTQRLEALGHLTGGVAHDVNNLLMVVSNNAYLLKRLPPGRDLSKPIDAILRAVATGARLTRQLLAFARRQALRPEVISPQERLPLLLDLMRHSISALVALRGEAAPDTRSIQVDPAELELAMINLAVNARDAMPDGGSLTVDIRNARPDEVEAGSGEWVSITVSDTGTGIPPEVIDHVFEPFFSTKEPGKGTGLGLSTVYGIVKQSGGWIWVESASGKGTTFRVYLPPTDASPATAPAPAPAVKMPATETVLLVEDQEDVRRLAAQVLRGRGYTVLEAGGATDLWDDRDSSHLLGTCRMGNDPNDSIVDKNGRSWSIPNLWICDGSLFPTSGGVNPSLTIQANALRIGDRIKEMASRGER